MEFQCCNQAKVSWTRKFEKCNAVLRTNKISSTSLCNPTTRCKSAPSAAGPGSWNWSWSTTPPMRRAQRRCVFPTQQQPSLLRDMSVCHQQERSCQCRRLFLLMSNRPQLPSRNTRSESQVPIRGCTCQDLYERSWLAYQVVGTLGIRHHLQGQSDRQFLPWRTRQRPTVWAHEQDKSELSSRKSMRLTCCFRFQSCSRFQIVFVLSCVCMSYMS